MVLDSHVPDILEQCPLAKAAYLARNAGRSQQSATGNGSATDRWNQEIARHVEAGMSRRDAIRELHGTELHRQYLEEYDRAHNASRTLRG